MNSKVVICGAGFLGKHIALALTSRSILSSSVIHQVQLASRNPERLHTLLKSTNSGILPPTSIDIIDKSTLSSAFYGASLVVSLVGIMHGSPADFDQIQWKGAENVAKAARDAGARLVHVSAIGADKDSPIPYNRTKALGEEAVREVFKGKTEKDLVVLRPSIVFGPEDDFFNSQQPKVNCPKGSSSAVSYDLTSARYNPNDCSGTAFRAATLDHCGFPPVSSRFSKLSKFLPFLPVFGGGTSRFQPVYVGDIARAVEIIARNDPAINAMVGGKIIECGGPDVLTYKEIMQLVLKHNRRRRPVVSLPFWMGNMQGAVMEQLPVNLFTVTRSQVQQLNSDNIVNNSASENSMGTEYFPFDALVEKYSISGTKSLASVHDVLPVYLT
ncbi:nucleoside-diphosphate-sugar epimerase [Lentinula detonsa]|uniref:Nucleoside-diphosphate-sugar epimerase n=1 Tax=Lentinula detonsa TaxID=2804962 RepID=A0A9W8PB83_9AGAR|nr:nucleoside-diphosphate-sugar epimerase [Lentinula detonsa]